MNKKSLYKIPSHEKQHNRVDIFRTIQRNERELQQEQQYNNNNNMGFSNTAFVSSDTNLNVPSSSSNVYTIPVHYTTARIQKANADKNKNMKSKKFKIILITSITIVIILILLAVGLALGFTLFKSKTYSDKKAYLCPLCDTNQICANYPDDRTPECICRQGYRLNSWTNKCEQNMCFSGYAPWTNQINENTTYGTSITDITNNKPLCCPSGLNYPSITSTSTKCCGVSNNDIFNKMKRIIGGTQSVSGNWPWIVDIIQVYRLNTNSQIEIINNCTGTLITDRHVLTAAHCLTFDPKYFTAEFPNLKSLVRVHFGFTSKSEIYGTPLLSLYERNVSNLYIHENFNENLLLNDIAILELSQPIQRSATVDYLCLYNYTNDDTIAYSQRVYAAGWGSTNTNINQPAYANTLQYVDLQVLDMSECYYIEPDPNNRFLFNQTKQVCAGYKVADRILKDTCFADSGGPLMIRLSGQWFNYGIVSFGSQTSCGEGPAVYTRTSYYYNWIMSKIG